MRLITIALAAALVAAAPAEAGETKDPITFRFDPAMLTSADGAEAVYKSMRAKAAHKCDPRGERVRSAVAACASDLVEQWVKAVGDARLTAVHQAAG